MCVNIYIYIRRVSEFISLSLSLSLALALSLLPLSHSLSLSLLTYMHIASGTFWQPTRLVVLIAASIRIRDPLYISFICRVSESSSYAYTHTRPCQNPPSLRYVKRVSYAYARMRIRIRDHIYISFICRVSESPSIIFAWFHRYILTAYILGSAHFWEQIHTSPSLYISHM